VRLEEDRAAIVDVVVTDQGGGRAVGASRRKEMGHVDVIEERQDSRQSISHLCSHDTPMAMVKDNTSHQ